jgi:hypothetical protein
MNARHLVYVVIVALVVAVVAPQAHAQGRGRGRGAPPASRPAPPVQRVPPVAAPPRVPANSLQKTGQLPRGYQEPAFARGYADGFKLGHDDNQGSKRYDPVGHRDYRDADQAYYSAYGSRDAYKNNYRAGFRQGYDDGYRANK